MQDIKNFNDVLAEKKSELVHTNAIEKIANFFGTLGFMRILTFFFLLWCGGNIIVDRTLHKAFDPYPFLFVSTMINMLSAYTTPILLAAGKAQQERDEMKADHEHQVNQANMMLNATIIKELRDTRTDLKQTIVNSSCNCESKDK